MGGIAARPAAACVCSVRAGRAGTPTLAGTSRRHPQLAISAVDRADAAGVAREVGVTLRPRKVLYVTAGVSGRGGGGGGGPAPPAPPPAPPPPTPRRPSSPPAPPGPPPAVGR